MCIKGLRRGLPLWPTRYKLQARSLLIIFPSPQLVSSIKRLCTCQIPLLPRQCSATVHQVQALLCTTAPPIHYKCLPKQGRQGHRFPRNAIFFKNKAWTFDNSKFRWLYEYMLILQKLNRSPDQWLILLCRDDILCKFVNIENKLHFSETWLEGTWWLFKV